ncbi:MAG TPA: DUF998 domain-containing protein [Polyangiaceae bacterium]|nr:DUF998 domain-containing protein [Polyangiaceae bacterium]
MSTDGRVVRLLLLCGVASPALYATADAIAGSSWHGYSFRDQTISELGALGAPSRAVFAVLLVPVYALLLAFGVGIWRSAEGRREIHALGALVMGFATVALTFGQFVPMHMRGVPQGLIGTLHLVEGGLVMLILLIAMIVAALSLGKGFRDYTLATILVVLAFGAWSAAEASRIELGLATPWVGVKERIFWYAYQVWFAVLALVLFGQRREGRSSQRVNSLRRR